MKVICAIFKYIGYVTVSVLIGLLSSFGGIEFDFVYSYAPTLLSILLTLTVLHCTLTGLLLAEILKFKDANPNIEIQEVLKSLKRSAIIELILICIVFMILIFRGVCENFEWNMFWVKLVVNSVVSFTFLYFILVLWDTIDGWFKLLRKNNA